MSKWWDDCEVTKFRVGDSDIEYQNYDEAKAAATARAVETAFIPPYDETYVEILGWMVDEGKTEPEWFWLEQVRVQITFGDDED